MTSHVLTNNSKLFWWTFGEDINYLTCFLFLVGCFVIILVLSDLFLPEEWWNPKL